MKFTSLSDIISKEAFLIKSYNKDGRNKDWEDPPPDDYEETVR
jgi:hypothetical protein